MSTVQVALVKVNSLDNLGYGVPVASSAMVAAAELATSSGTATAASTLASAAIITGEDPRKYIWRVAVKGTDDIYITFGTTPVATSTSGFLCLAGGVYEFSVSAFGHKFSVINA